MRTFAGSMLLLLIAAAGCQPSPPGTSEMLDSSAGVERMRAVTRLSNEHRWTNIPVFIHHLEDPDVSVRWAAVQALTTQVGTDLGFRASDPPEPRAAAVQRWQQWWQTEGSQGPQARRPSPDS